MTCSHPSERVCVPIPREKNSLLASTDRANSSDTAMVGLVKHPQSHVVHATGCMHVTAARARPVRIVKTKEGSSWYLEGTRTQVKPCRRCLKAFPALPLPEPEPITCMACAEDICPSSHAVSTPCAEEDHHLCPDCCSRYVEALLTYRHDLSTFPCPCGAPVRLPWTPADLPREALHVWVRKLGQEKQETVAETAQEFAHPVPWWARRPLASLREHAAARACPCCGLRFDVFDGCAAITCPCGCHFCGLCFQTCNSSSEAHNHVAHKCPMNASHTGTYYVPLEHVQAAWDTRTQNRLHSAVHTITGTGVLGWMGRRALYWGLRWA